MVKCEVRGTDFWHKAPRLMIHPDRSEKRLVRRGPGNFGDGSSAGRGVFFFVSMRVRRGWGNDDAVWSLTDLLLGGWDLVEKKTRMGRGSGVSQGVALSRPWIVFVNMPGFEYLHDSVDTAPSLM